MQEYQDEELYSQEVANTNAWLLAFELHDASHELAVSRVSDDVDLSWDDSEGTFYEIYLNEDTRHFE